MPRGRNGWSHVERQRRKFDARRALKLRGDLAEGLPGDRVAIARREVGEGQGDVRAGEDFRVREVKARLLVLQHGVAVKREVEVNRARRVAVRRAYPTHAVLD